VERVQVGARVVALEDVRILLGLELPQAEHRVLGGSVVDPARLLAAGARLLAAEEPQQVMMRVIDRRRVRLAADVILGLAHDQVQRGEDVHRARAGSRMPADLGVAGPLVRAVVGEVDHVHRLREGARGDALEHAEIESRVRRCGLGVHQLSEGARVGSRGTVGQCRIVLVLAQLGCAAHRWVDRGSGAGTSAG
jgi:hypothetical protein